MKRFFFLFAFCFWCSSTPAPPYAGPQPLPGEQACDPASIQAQGGYTLSFDPPSAVVAPGQTRAVRLLVNPDVCTPSTVTFTIDNPAIAAPPAIANIDLRHATYDFAIQGKAIGKATLTATMNDSSVVDGGTPAAGKITIDVRDPALPTCAFGDASTGTLSGAATTFSGQGTLANASIGSPAGSFARTDWLKIPTFTASIACDNDLSGAAGTGYLPLSPAVSYLPTSGLSEITPLRRELDFALPINPADFPPTARMRHLEVLFKNKRAQTPRPIIIASPRIDQTADGNYVLRFSSPWFGTYQAAMRSDAGTRMHTRHLTHRAVIGISMGGGGAATFGFRHHQQFDAIGPMGGPSDWTWLGWFVEQYALGGFCTAANPGCTIPAPDSYPMTDTYAHTEDFNHWWYEAGSGNGGHFPRSDYEQIFTDLALQRNNPNAESLDPAIPYFARGPKATDPWVVGDTTLFPPGTNCAFTLSPLDVLPDGGTDPGYANEQAAQTQCAKTRCDAAHAFIVPSGYYNGEYNPDGSKQVISICDGNQIGSANNDSASPYENTFLPPSPDQAYPMSLALAVDLNKNGVRDENEPLIRSGHEPWTDTGVDGLADASEPGYDAINNPDPNGDDYDPYINPTGTENDHRYQMGEPYKDYGLDGVANTASSIYDFGEGDGKFTMASGYANFLAVDPHAILRGWSNQTDTGGFTDDDLSRFSIWSDGGVRDLFNFGAVATHLSGAISSRRTSDGHAIQSVAFYNNFNLIPGQDITRPDNFQASAIRWADVAGAPSLRYGTVDATPVQILQGDGQHVGTGAQILYRLEAAFYYVAHQWPDADRSLTNPASDNPEPVTSNVLGTGCEIVGHCEGVFTGTKSGRTGPIAITLPPGYANADNQARNVRYPVVFVLHGYGQKPQDLEALQIISNNFMNDGTQSYESRLGKFIAVYVDGRCREGTSTNGNGTPIGQPECIQGGFYLDSARPGGVLFDTWFDELVDYVDQNYRTMPPSDVSVTE